MFTRLSSSSHITISAFSQFIHYRYRACRLANPSFVESSTMPLPIIRSTKLTTAKSDPQRDDSVHTIQHLPCVHNCVKSGTTWTHAFGCIQHICALPENRSLSPEEMRLKHYYPGLSSEDLITTQRPSRGEPQKTIKQEHEDFPGLQAVQYASFNRTGAEEAVFNSELLPSTSNASQHFQHEEVPRFIQREHDDSEPSRRRENKSFVKAEVEESPRTRGIAKLGGSLDRTTSSADDESLSPRRRRGRLPNNTRRKTNSYSVKNMHDDLARVMSELADLKHRMEESNRKERTPRAFGTSEFLSILDISRYSPIYLSLGLRIDIRGFTKLRV